jgi:hypothetical protein
VANPLTFLRPLRHETIHSILLVQSGPIDLALQVARRLQTTFPGCEVEAVVREDDRDAAAAGGFARLLVVRWEDRLEVIRRLRRRRYDTVVVLMSHRGSDYLRVLPYLLRTRSVLVFNDHLDCFPLHVTRVATLALHVSGRESVGGLARWALGGVVLGMLALGVLVGSMARIHVRAAWRRARA